MEYNQKKDYFLFFIAGVLPLGIPYNPFRFFGAYENISVCLGPLGRIPPPEPPPPPKNGGSPPFDEMLLDELLLDDDELLDELLDDFELDDLLGLLLLLNIDDEVVGDDELLDELLDDEGDFEDEILDDGNIKPELLIDEDDNDLLLEDKLDRILLMLIIDEDGDFDESPDLPDAPLISDGISEIGTTSIDNGMVEERPERPDAPLPICILPLVICIGVLLLIIGTATLRSAPTSDLPVYDIVSCGERPVISWYLDNLSGYTLAVSATVNF